MPAKPSGQIKTLTVRQTQKNGDIYVLECLNPKGAFGGHHPRIVV